MLFTATLEFMALTNTSEQRFWCGALSNSIVNSGKVLQLASTAAPPQDGASYQQGKETVACLACKDMLDMFSKNHHCSERPTTCSQQSSSTASCAGISSTEALVNVVAAMSSSSFHMPSIGGGSSVVLFVAILHHKSCAPWAVGAFTGQIVPA